MEGNMNRTDTAVIEYKCANPNMMFDTSDMDDTNSGRKCKVDGKKVAYKRLASHNILTEEEVKELKAEVIIIPIMNI